MKKRVLILSTALTLVGVGLYLFLPLMQAGAASGSAADFTLFDQTGGDVNARCRTINGRPFTFYLSVRAFGGPVTMRVGFRDGDFVDYPLAQDQVFALQQVAGTTPRADGGIVVAKAGGTGSLVGWLSAARLPDTTALVQCFATHP